MKIRNGFVSNSSSASFIATLALTDNQDVIDEMLKDTHYDHKIVHFNELRDLNRYDIDVTDDHNQINIEWNYGGDGYIFLDINKDDITEDSHFVFYCDSGYVGYDENGFEDYDNATYNDISYANISKINNTAITYREGKWAGRDG